MMRLTSEIAFAAASDVGNRHMQAAGRFKWEAEDYDAAAAEYTRLWHGDGTVGHPACANPDCELVR